MRRALAAMVLSLLVPHRGAAQTVGGHVADRESRHPLRGVVVRVLSAGDTVLAETTTDSAGVFYAMLSRPATIHLELGVDGTSANRSDSLVVHADEFVQRDFLVDFPEVYFDFQVERTASTVPRQPGPRYPPELKAQELEGRVEVQFVVDTTGHALAGSIRPLRSSHPAFTSAVVKFLRTATFYPAEVKGRKVRQLVQQPFDFMLGR